LVGPLLVREFADEVEVGYKFKFKFKFKFQVGYMFRYCTGNKHR
jgi:hypothetical protein